MLSYLSSGFPASASESARLLGMISGSGLFVLMCCIALLVVGYMFHVASRQVPRA